MNSEQIRNSIEIAVDEFSTAVINFADQLATANDLAALVESPEDFETLHHYLFNHASQHMRRIGSLALLNLPYRFYPQAANWAERNLQDEFKWVKYDAVRFFYVNASLDERILNLIEKIPAPDSDLLKVINLMQTATQEIKDSYQAALAEWEYGKVKLSIPVDWVEISKSDKAVLYATPDLESCRQTKIKYLSTLQIQVIPNLKPEEIKDMIDLNMELARDLNNELHGYETGKKDTRVIYTNDPPEDYPVFLIREFIHNESTLAVVTVTAPLAHIEFALARNLSILDSIEVCG